MIITITKSYGLVTSLLITSLPRKRKCNEYNSLPRLVETIAIGQEMDKEETVRKLGEYTLCR